MHPLWSVLLLSMTFLPATAPAQTPDSNPYSRRNTLTALAEYSNDSSHIILGSTPNRKLAALGAQYERRLVANPHLTWSYVAELRPFLLSSDPFASSVYTETSTGPNSLRTPEPPLVSPFAARPVRSQTHRRTRRQVLFTQPRS